MGTWLISHGSSIHLSLASPSPGSSQTKTLGHELIRLRVQAFIYPPLPADCRFKDVNPLDYLIVKKK